MLHVKTQHGDTVVARFGNDQILGPHARIVRQQAGEELCGVMLFQPGASVGGDRKGGTVGFGKPEAAKP